VVAGVEHDALAPNAHAVARSSAVSCRLRHTGMLCLQQSISFQSTFRAISIDNHPIQSNPLAQKNVDVGSLAGVGDIAFGGDLSYA
jgi:hypothetical protein